MAVTGGTGRHQFVVCGYVNPEEEASVSHTGITRLNEKEDSHIATRRDVSWPMATIIDQTTNKITYLLEEKV